MRIRRRQVITDLHRNKQFRNFPMQIKGVKLSSRLGGFSSSRFGHRPRPQPCDLPSLSPGIGDELPDLDVDLH